LPGQKVAQKARRQLNSPSIADPDLRHRPFHPSNIGLKQKLSQLRPSIAGLVEVFEILDDFIPICRDGSRRFIGKIMDDLIPICQHDASVFIGIISHPSSLISHSLCAFAPLKSWKISSRYISRREMLFIGMPL
jgi:hypothetical protein